MPTFLKNDATGCAFAYSDLLPFSLPISFYCKTPTVKGNFGRLGIFGSTFKKGWLKFSNSELVATPHSLLPLRRRDEDSQAATIEDGRKNRKCETTSNEISEIFTTGDIS